MHQVSRVDNSSFHSFKVSFHAFSCFFFFFVYLFVIMIVQYHTLSPQWMGSPITFTDPEGVPEILVLENHCLEGQLQFILHIKKTMQFFLVLPK